MSQSHREPKFALLPSGIRLAYDKFPGKHKIPLFCIHGLTGNLRNFEPIAHTLSKKGITVITYDLRGRGHSDKPEGEYSARIHARDLKDLAQVLGYKRIAVLSHSLGCWVALRLAELSPQLLEKVILVDGGGALSPRRKFSNLLMIRSSLARLGRVVPSKEIYLAEAKKSPILSAWNEDIRNFLQYELEPIGTLSKYLGPREESGPFGPVQCSLPPRVAESELQSMGGSIHPIGIFRRFLKNPISSLRILKENNILPYSALTCPVLVVRAGKPNFKPGDELLPDSAVEKMRREMRDFRLLEVPDKNHYEVVLLEDKLRDKEIYDFLIR
ncbi:putative lysophospholipase [Leptospira fainei serovar Hurstbridge str. BUT 6]|uniref:Lysophospholipase n=1 Tax=Leptospira fainei serovar Hurstbridge str. BUT 6 TaxID=1193011 RepID=S3W584_9LEPT|nr:alpha/beta hydrolase [Leptospira fainei]EPG75407.1 putative lysophospholipase [Leptospira fainei serovar Hurstbridge str. BUT 6]